MCYPKHRYKCKTYMIYANSLKHPCLSITHLLFLNNQTEKELSTI